MNLKCAIFDFDGTLFDSMSVWDMVGEMYLRSLEKEPKPSMREDIRELSLYESACYFQREYALSLSPREIMEGVNRIIEQYFMNEVLPKKGVPAFLEQMARTGIPMCIATAAERYQIEAALKRCGLDHYFDAIFTCSEVECGKNEPLIFRKAMEFFGAERCETVIFEDAMHAVQTAKADGFMVAAVFDDSEKRQGTLRELADCYIEDFEHTEDFWQFVSRT